MENSHDPPLVTPVERNVRGRQGVIKPLYIVLVVGGGSLVLLFAGWLAYWVFFVDGGPPKHEQDKHSSEASSIPWTPPPKPHLRLSYDWSAGTLMVHDLCATNTSGHDLKEVRLKVTFVGENGSPTVDRYWTAWPLGERKDISISVDKVKNVQRLSLLGSADEGEISDDLAVTSR
jgi:hypothetical protein